MPVWGWIVVVIGIVGAWVARKHGVGITDIIGRDAIATAVALTAGVLSLVGASQFRGGSPDTKLEAWAYIVIGLSVAVLVFLGVRVVL